MSYNVTSAGSKAPQEFNAETNNRTVELTWKKSVSADCIKYVIYRLNPDSEEYKEVAVINDRNTVRYIDKTVSAGEEYTYKISGVNSFDIEGEASNTAQVTVTEDKAIPVIKAITADKSRLNSGGGTGGIGGTWSGGGTYSTSSGGNISFSPVVRQDAPEEHPILAYVYVNQSISFMKEMYAVNLGVLNNADKQFVIENSSATLNLPYGLSLAAPNQTLTQSMGSIAGQQRKTIGCRSKETEKESITFLLTSKELLCLLLPIQEAIRLLIITLIICLSVTFEYDANNNLLKMTDAEGNSTSYTYDKYGRMTSSTDANGNITT